jgi:hypothetical protein
MRSREDLFSLIQSMSKSEKRYFVLDAKKSGRTASRYLSLFDAINGMEDYDEEPLKELFPNNLSSDKAYLYEAILRSMRDYRSKNSKAAQVKERLMDAKYLHERGLYDQSNNRILEAKAISKELEDQFTLLEILREEQLSLYDRRVRVEFDHINTLREEKEVIMDFINEELKYVDLYFLLLIEVFRGAAPQGEALQELKKQIPLDWLDKQNLPSSPRAQRRFFLCNALYGRLLGDTDRQYQFYSKAVNWWSGYPSLKEEEFHRYVSDVGNLVSTCYNKEALQPEAQRWIDRLKNEEYPDNYHDQRFVFLTLSMTNLLHLLNRREFTQAHKLLPEIIDGMNRFGLKKSIFILSNIVDTYFLAEDYENCVKWVEQITKNTKTGTREDVQRLMRLFELISLFEMDDVDALESALRSTSRYFKKSGLPEDRFENIVLNQHLKRIFNVPVGELKRAYADFNLYLEDIDRNMKSEKPIGLDEFMIWVKKHLS